jgi:hypothetical protein
VHGSESALVELVPGAQRAARAENTVPAADSLIALDPDIPEALQRVSFRAQAGQGLSWRLNPRDRGYPLRSALNARSQDGFAKYSGGHCRTTYFSKNIELTQIRVVYLHGLQARLQRGILPLSLLPYVT